MTIVHIVLFSLKQSLSTTEVDDFFKHLDSLKHGCVSPDNGKPYILEGSCGKDNSPEGQQGGLTHGFVAEFASVEDRDYYVFKDPYHSAFVDKNKPKLESIKIIDFEKGVH